MFIQGVGTTDSGGGSFAISDDGEVVIQTTDSEEFRLLGSASYPQGLRVRMTGTGETGFISYSAETGIFTVSFAIADAQGNILKETCFDVKRINAGKKWKKSCRTKCPQLLLIASCDVMHPFAAVDGAKVRWGPLPGARWRCTGRTSRSAP